MPRYDYKCIDCESEFEIVQSFSEAGHADCPQCSGAGRRVFHAVPVIYKGSGFYTTDYARPKRPSENGSKETSESKADSSDSSSDSTSSGSSSSGAKDSKSTATESASSSSDSKSESAAKASSEAKNSS